MFEMDMNELNKFLDCKNAFESAQQKIGGEAKEIYLEYFKAGMQHQQAKVEELQKRVDKAIQAINEHYDSDGMSGLYFMDLKEILEGEQALKGEG